MTDTFNIPHNSSATPVKLKSSHKFSFHCHPKISCYNNCCKQADITLTPYDIIRLKQNLKLTSTEFLKQYTVPFEMDADGMPGVKLRHNHNTTQCKFMTDYGCSVYQDRPTACRYYPLGQLSLHQSDTSYDEIYYVKITEQHCKGHLEKNSLTIDNYCKSQDIKVYDKLNRTWQQIILKRKSTGSAVGKPSPTSFQFYFMALFDQDRFRQFLQTDNFTKTYQLETGLLDKIIKDDIECLQFAYRLLLQVLFGEKTITMNPDALTRRMIERQTIWQQRQEAERILYQQKQILSDD